jgi:hypothetical protein
MEEFFAKFSRHFRHDEMPKHWKESHGWFSHRHAPADYRRERTRSARNRENHELRSAFANGNLENYEPLHIEKYDADWHYF